MWLPSERVAPHPVIQAWRGVDRSTPLLGRHTGLTVSDTFKHDEGRRSAGNEPRCSADRHAAKIVLTSERQWCMKLQEGNIIVESVWIETLVADDFLNCVGSRGSHLEQADVAGAHSPQSRVGVP